LPARARELARGRRALAALLEPLLQLREALVSQRDRLHRLVVAATRDDEVCRRLMSVPGVGPVTALTFCSAVDDPARFSRSRAVGANFGRTPRRYQPGETDRVGQISKQGDELARQALHEAANVLLTRTSRWSSLKALGRKAGRACGDGSGTTRPMGHGHRQARGHAPGESSRRPQARRRAAPDVVRRHRVPLGQGAGNGIAAAPPPPATAVPSRGRGRARPQPSRCRRSPSPPARLARSACLAVACGGSTTTTNRSEDPRRDTQNRSLTDQITESVWSRGVVVHL
jgi:Transposase IS116/IS110/IS902 family